MAAQIGNLQIRIGADIGDLQSRMRVARREVANAADEMNVSLARLGKGFGSVGKNGQEVTQVTLKMRDSAKQMLATIDPLYAAQLRYDKELEKASKLYRSGALTATEFAKVQTGLKSELDAATGSVQGFHKANGMARIGQMELGHAARSAAEMIALGQSPMRALALEMGRVTQGVGFLAGGTSKFAAFMGGPWGIAITAATLALAPLLSKLFETKDSLGDLVNKMREEAKQSALNEQAERAWKASLEGVQQALKDNRKSLDELAVGEKSKARLDLEAALAAKDRTTRIIEETEANITLARSLYEVQKARASGPGQRGEIAALGLEGKLGNLDELRSRLAKSRGALAEANRQIEEATSQLIKDVATRSPAERIAQQYDRLIEQARRRAVAEHKVGDELIRQIASLEKQKEAAIKAAEESARADRQFGRQIDFSQAAAIARAAGLQVNSGYRSNARQAQLYNDPNVNRPGNPVAPPGASAHNGANGKWAIDIQITDGLTPGKIRSIYAAQGVSLSKILKENGHFHIEGSRSEAASAEREAEAAANKAKRLAEERTRQNDSFEEARDRLNSMLLQAQDALVKGVEGQADAASRRVLDEEARNQNAIAHDLAEGKYGDATSKVAQARAEQLQEINHSVATERLAAINAQRAEALEEAAFKLRDQAMSLAIDGLQFQNEIAHTQEEHRKAQLAILDAVYEQKRLELEHEKQLAIRNGATADEIAAIQAKIDNLGTEKSRDQQRTINSTRNPIEEWAATVPKSAAEINEALQSIEANGIQGLTDALTGVLRGTESLKSAFHNLAASILADLIQMTIKMLLFRALTAAFGGAFGGGGNIPAPNLGATAAVNISSVPVAGFATGGSITVGGHSGTDKNLLSLNGMPIAKVSYGERINIANDNAMGGSPSVSLTFHNDFRGADPSAVASINARLNQMQAELPGTIVSTMNDARERFLWRGK